MSETKLKIYLAGPMTGHPEYNYPAFRQQAGWLRDAGYEVVSPAELGVDQDHMSWADCLKASLTAMMTCDALALMDGWFESEGARFEHEIARKLQMRSARVKVWLEAAGVKINA